MTNLYFACGFASLITFRDHKCRYHRLDQSSRHLYRKFFRYQLWAQMTIRARLTLKHNYHLTYYWLLMRLYPLFAHSYILQISKSRDDWKLQPLQASLLGRVLGSNWWSRGKVYHRMALHLVKFYSLGFLKYHTYRDQSDMVSSHHRNNGPSFDSNLSCFLERYLSIP